MKDEAKSSVQRWWLEKPFFALCAVGVFSEVLIVLAYFKGAVPLDAVFWNSLALLSLPPFYYLWRRRRYVALYLLFLLLLVVTG